MAEEIIVKKWGEVLKQLEQDGLPKEKAREVLPGAISFLCEAEAKSRGQYLPAEVVKVQKKTIQYLNQIKENYPTIKGYIDYLFREERARLFLERIKKEVAEKGEPRNTRILFICDEGLEMGVMTEWTYLGKEKKMWRRTDKEGGEVGINFKTLEAGIHIFDFRPETREERKMRHFLPTDWHGRNQVALARHLGELTRKAEESYKAFRAAKKAENPAAVETPVAPAVAVAPPAEKPTRKSAKKTEGDQKAEPKTTKVTKVKGGRGGAKVALRGEAEEALES